MTFDQWFAKVQAYNSDQVELTNKWGLLTSLTPGYVTFNLSTGVVANVPNVGQMEAAYAGTASTLTTNLATETTNRTTADTALGALISNLQSYVESSSLGSIVTIPSTGAPTNITSITLTAGTWLVEGSAQGSWISSGSANLIADICSTTTVIGTNSIYPGISSTQAWWSSTGTIVAGYGEVQISLPRKKVIVSSTTSYYLNVSLTASGTIPTFNGSGFMSAQRIA